MNKEKYYEKIMDHVNNLKESYNDFKQVTLTNGIQVDDNFFVENNLGVLNCKVTILDSTPVIANITDGALYISDTLTSKNNIMVNYGITNKNHTNLVNSKFNKSNTNNLYINNDANINNISSNNIYCNQTIIDNILESNTIIGNDCNLNEGTLICNTASIEYGNIYENCYYNYINVDKINTKNILGSIISNVIVANSIQNIQNMKLKKNTNIENINISGKVNFKKITSDIKIAKNLITVLPINSSIQYKNNTSDINTIESNVITNNLNTTGIIKCSNIFLNNLEIIYIYNDDNPNKDLPLCVDQNSLLKITNFKLYFYGYEYNNNYSFCLINNINFSNLFINFNLLTFFYDEQLPDLIKYKPKKKFNIIVSGFRNSGSTIYSVLYNVDFFSKDPKQINISIISDENNEIFFKNNFRYVIHKFNFNYVI